MAYNIVGGEPRNIRIEREDVQDNVQVVVVPKDPVRIPISSSAVVVTGRRPPRLVIGESNGAGSGAAGADGKSAYEIAVLLIIAGFLVPPMGVIDGSVLQAVGEIIAIIGLFFAWESVDRGIDAKFTHGSTTVEINNPDGEKE